MKYLHIDYISSRPSQTSAEPTQDELQQVDEGDRDIFKQEGENYYRAVVEGDAEDGFDIAGWEQV